MPLNLGLKTTVYPRYQVPVARLPVRLPLSTKQKLRTVLQYGPSKHTSPLSFRRQLRVCRFPCNNNNSNNNNRIQRRNSRFFTISSLRRELSPTRTLKWPGRNRVQITCNTSSAYQVQHVVLHATWYEGTAQLLSLTELKSHLFELYFIG